SESPAFDLHHPEIAALEMAESDALRREEDVADAPNVSGRRGHLEQQMGGTTIEEAVREDDHRDEDGR
ncbi:MAG TPA: hypothetical protein VK204_08125, partial [Nocardioidaceae bacterium]|nr:hypothetical protein [Nocardioidaceae bacterium]